MTSDTIKWGETYDFILAAVDAAGVALDPAPDATWSAAFRVTRGRIGGKIVADGNMTIADGVAAAAINTGDAAWQPGIYWYDGRLTDPDGNHYWSDAHRLVVKSRNTPIPAAPEA